MMVLIFLSLCFIARNLFHVLEVGKVGKLDNSLDMINFFTGAENLPLIQFNLSKDIAEIIKGYEERNKIKVDFLNSAFKEIKFCGLMFVLTVLFIVIDTIIK
ncbi:hypothetical protein F960_02647 [Acinetobacter gerneri DSM 14967 = CIP 107464 = MTCC 9824]|uniref:Uncharacterized protein n=1 Tax=Acinetobacter gerneri DSM 14967 = CIP 107464 = MTCC 9824 TaxID=1120926 RepID=N8ZN38_9GAMM|nr:hypothetical protein F960_02647 [Acinetobacter gerneri DSM 14967 = CIP 107464 = MTCC 9824]